MLSIINRQPKALPVRLEFEVLMKDLSTCKVEVHFNPNDDWNMLLWRDPEDIVDRFRNMVINNLQSDWSGQSILGFKNRCIDNQGNVIKEYRTVVLSNKAF